MDEKQAIAQLKRGDPGGLEVLVRLYQLPALRAAALIVGDPAVAEDIVQNAFLRAGERIAQFDEQRPFKPWFLRSVVYDAIKAAKRDRRFISLDDEEENAIRIDLADPSPLPEELVESREFTRAVWRALEQLPPHQRAAIVLRYYLDMREDEMGKELQSPTGTIKWWLHDARRRLAKLLRSSAEPEAPFPSENPPHSRYVGKSGGKR